MAHSEAVVVLPVFGGNSDVIDGTVVINTTAKLQKPQDARHPRHLCCIHHFSPAHRFFSAQLNWQCWIRL